MYRRNLCFIVFCFSLFLTGCSRVDFSDLVTSAGAGLTATASAAAGLPPVATGILTTAGAVGAGALVEDQTTETIGEVCAQVPDEMKADCVKDQTLLRTIKDWGEYAIYAILAFFVITFAIGYFIPNGQHRKLKKRMFDDPKIKHTDM